MDYNEHKKHFEIAYKTGTDFWPHSPVELRKEKLIEHLPKGARILDIGSGRGFFARHLAKMGFQVIGLDFEGNIVKKANSEIADWGLTGKLKFIEANALSIPLTDGSFDAVCDFGLFETLFKADWPVYAAEISRVLRPGGIYLNVSLSRKTEKFFEFSPINSTDGEFEKYGIHYHFFEKEEMSDIFKKYFKIENQEIEFTKNDNQVALLETLFRK